LLSLPGTRVWLRQPEHKLDDPGNPVTQAFAIQFKAVITGFPLSRE
jgi:hypothetical protein